MNYSNPLDAVPDVSLETRIIITENQCVILVTECEFDTTNVIIREEKESYSNSF
jgi:hypothetical protein